MTDAALDACLCLLLISAAAVTVTSVPSLAAGETDRADAVAETLIATTAELTYSLRPAPDGGEGTAPQSNPELDRTAHGTLASLLADAAVRTVRVDDAPLTGTSEGFANAVRAAVADRLPPRTRVVVRWRPIPGGHIGREFSVGPTPPLDADVHAETVHAPSGVDAPSDAAQAARNGGIDGIARVTAESIVAGLLPPEKGRLALAGDPPLTELVRHRYHRVSDRYGVDTADAVGRGDTETANRRVATAMTERVAEDLRNTAEAPSDAAESLAIDTVEISVRTWSP